MRADRSLTASLDSRQGLRDRVTMIYRREKQTTKTAAPDQPATGVEPSRTAPLPDSEGRFRALAETASDAIITIDERGTIVFVNPATERVFGHAQHEMIGAKLTTLMPLSLRDAHRAGFQRYKDTGRRRISWQAIELPGLHKSGREVPLEISFAEFTQNGRRFFTGIARDITERKRAEQRLNVQYAVARVLAEAGDLRAVAPQLLQAICQTTDWKLGVLWQVDHAADVLRCVEIWSSTPGQFPEFIALSRERTFVSGVGLPGRVWAGGAPAWIPDVTQDDNFPRAPIAAKEGLRGAFAFPIRLGEEFLGLIEFFSPEIRQPQEEFLQMMAALGSQIGQFIERKRVEAALQRAKADLEVEVHKRTARLTETIAELESYSYTLVHDMRAPLRAMQGFATFLAEECGDRVGERGRDFIQRIIVSSDRMDRLIQDVLSYSRVAHGDLPLAPVDLHQLLHNILQSYPAFQSPEVEIRLDHALPVVLGNEALLTQCLSNLLGNAVKFVAPGVKPCVRLWCEACDARETPAGAPASLGSSPQREPVPATPWSRIWIEDNGIGIPKDMQGRLFGVFERLNREYEGTGIGLAIVRKAVERMGGAVGVESESGRGSRFWIALRRGQ